jgi:hypothetical protein
VGLSVQIRKVPANKLSLLLPHVKKAVCSPPGRSLWTFPLPHMLFIHMNILDISQPPISSCNLYVCLLMLFVGMRTLTCSSILEMKGRVVREGEAPDMPCSFIQLSATVQLSLFKAWSAQSLEVDQSAVSLSDIRFSNTLKKNKGFLIMLLAISTIVCCFTPRYLLLVKRQKV